MTAHNFNSNAGLFINEADKGYKRIGMERVDWINSTVARHSSIRIAMSMLLPRLTRTGVSFVFKDGTEEKPMIKDSVMEQVRREWNNATKSMIKRFIIDGFAVIRRMPSDRNKAIFVPSVMKSKYFVIATKFDPATNKDVYRAYWRNLYEDDAMQKLGWEAGSNGMHDPRNGDHIRDAIVLSLYEPNEHDLMPDSPVATISSDVMTLAVTGKSATYAMFHQAHPIFPFGFRRDAMSASASKNPGMGPFIGITDLAFSHTAQKTQEANAKRKDVTDDTTQAVIRQLGIIMRRQQSRIAEMEAKESSISGFVSSETVEDELASNPPYMNMLSLTAGQELQKAPVPEVPANYVEIMNVSRKVIMMTLGVNPQLAGVEKANFAANSELAFNTFNENVLNYQGEIEPLLELLFEFIYDFQFGTIDADLGEQVDDSEPVASSSSSDDKKRSQQIAQHSSKRSRSNNTIHVVAKLRSSPVSPLDTLLTLFHYGFIDHEVAKEHAISLVGMHKDTASDIKLTRQDFMPPPDAKKGSTSLASAGSLSSH